MTRQVRAAVDAVPADVDLLVGAPAFHEQDTFHQQSAETVAAAVRAARLAYADASATHRGYGVPIYVDFAATQQDWRDYENGWVHPPSGS